MEAARLTRSHVQALLDLGQAMPEDSARATNKPAKTWSLAFAQRSDVVAGGVQHQRWKVRLNGAWLSPEECLERGVPGERRGASHIPSGCQYWQEVELNLPVGTEVERHSSQPLDRRGEGIDSFLENPSREQRRKTRTLYRVAANGKLERIPSRGST